MALDIYLTDKMCDAKIAESLLRLIFCGKKGNREKSTVAPALAGPN